MNSLIELLKLSAGSVLVNEDGIKSELKLLPPLSAEELAALPAKIPCAIPDDIQEVLRFARGFDGTWLDAVEFVPSRFDFDMGFGMEQIFPHALPLTHDGAGNYWVIDLTKESKSWGPIFYACHDAPVLVYQTDSLLHFVQEVIREANKPWKSEVQDVWGPLSNLIWAENPGALSFWHCIKSPDQEIRTFAESLDENWQFIDLRNPVLGDGFSWGRYGPKTQVKRFGEKRLFAYQKKTMGRRFLEVLR
jgi:hypothetical protein